MKEYFPHCFEVEGNPSFEVQNVDYICFGESYFTGPGQDSAVQLAVLSHDRLVELLEYFYKQPVDLSQVWPAGHIAKQNEAASLLKELGHEI